MKHIVFDIETIPQDEAKLLALAPEFTAPANLKDPEKIAAAIAKKRADYLADAALNWKTAEVVLIGAGDDTEIQSFTAGTEKELVGQLPVAAGRCAGRWRGRGRAQREGVRPADAGEPRAGSRPEDPDDGALVLEGPAARGTSRFSTRWSCCRSAGRSRATAWMTWRGCSGCRRSSGTAATFRCCGARIARRRWPTTGAMWRSKSRSRASAGASERRDAKTRRLNTRKETSMTQI